MRIGIDLHTLTNFKQGTHTYTMNIVKELLAMDRDNEYVMYITKKNEGIRDVFNQSNVSFHHVFPHQRLMRIPVSLPIRLAYDRIDVFHCQYMAPLTAITPFVVMMHDVIHEYMPEFYPKGLCLMMRTLYPLSVKRAKHVLTVSENSKRDIMKYYDVPAEKITVTYDAVSDTFHPIDDPAAIESVKARYGIRGEYIFYVGRLEPRKNLANLIRAYHQMKHKEVCDHKLVIAGMKYYQYEMLFSLVLELGLLDDVIFPGHVEDNDLPFLMNGATAFAYPTFAEGFGIPPLEAMACGTPVVTSNTSSLPEVVGEAGLMVDPNSVSELASALERLVSDEALRRTLSQRGLEQAKLFRWDDSARKTLDVFRKVHSGR